MFVPPCEIKLSYLLSICVTNSVASAISSAFIKSSLDILDKSTEEILYKVRKTLAQNISGEKSAKEEYRKLAKCSCDSKISKILERIADDEELHEEIFEKILYKITF